MRVQRSAHTAADPISVSTFDSPRAPTAPTPRHAPGSRPHPGLTTLQPHHPRPLLQDICMHMKGDTPVRERQRERESGEGKGGQVGCSGEAGMQNHLHNKGVPKTVQNNMTTKVRARRGGGCGPGGTFYILHRVTDYSCHCKKNAITEHIRY